MSIFVSILPLFLRSITKVSIGLHFDACAHSQLQAGGHPRYSAGDVAVHDVLPYVSDYFQQRPAQAELFCDMRDTSGRHWKKGVHGVIKIYFYLISIECFCRVYFHQRLGVYLSLDILTRDLLGKLCTYSVDVPLTRHYYEWVRPHTHTQTHPSTHKRLLPLINLWDPRRSRKENVRWVDGALGGAHTRFR